MSCAKHPLCKFNLPCRIKSPGLAPWRCQFAGRALTTRWGCPTSIRPREDNLQWWAHSAVLIAQLKITWQQGARKERQELAFGCSLIACVAWTTLLVMGTIMIEGTLWSSDRSWALLEHHRVWSIIVNYTRVWSILCSSGIKYSFNMDSEYFHSCYNKNRRAIPYRPFSVSR